MSQSWLKRLLRTLCSINGLCLLSLLAMSGSVRGQEDNPRPNVVWIISDDLSPELGCYGYGAIRTPIVDSLARTGVRFQNAFATAPVCSSSRSALITGVYQTTTGTHQHRTLAKVPLRAPFRPVTELLKEAGYFVANANSSLRSAGKTDYNFRVESRMYDGIHWNDRDRDEGQPFFLQVQIHEPHRDFERSSTADRERFAEAEVPAYYPEHPVVRADWSDYLHTVEVMDRKVGAVLHQLKEDGLYENTAIFFFGDHGRPHYRDKQWLYDGGIRVPLIVKLPGEQTVAKERTDLVSLLDVTASTLGIAGVDIPDWMNGHDLFVEGYTPRNEIFAARDRCGSTLDRIRCLRTARYKYIRNFYPERPYSQHSGYKFLQYPAQTAAQSLYELGELHGPARLFWEDVRPAEELYDLEKDPSEVENLAGQGEYAETLKELRRRLDTWIVRTNDQGELPEGGEQAAVESSENWFRGRMKKRGLPLNVTAEEYLGWWEEQLGISGSND